MNENRPVVSVIMLTYNQEAYIRQALDSVLMQETQFPFEILVGEDASTDGTAEIVADYAQRFPERIRAFCRTENLGAARNAYELLMSARGEYLAFCEGDDYWLSRDKLQKQYQFLSEHPDYIGCCCKSLLVDAGGRALPNQRLSWVRRKSRFTFRDFCGGKYLPGQTATVMKRNIFLDTNTDWGVLYAVNRQINDRIATELYLLRGDFHCQAETMSAYRKRAASGEENLTSRLYKDNARKCEDELALTEALERCASDSLKRPVVFYRKRSDILLDAVIELARHRDEARRAAARHILRLTPLSSLLLLPLSAAEKLINHFTGS